jgi:hypothetical protein
VLTWDPGSNTGRAGSEAGGEVTPLLRGPQHAGEDQQGRLRALEKTSSLNVE